jgi:hypothetical protein
MFFIILLYLEVTSSEGFAISRYYISRRKQI